MSLQVMLVSELHNTVQTLEFLLVGVGNEMSLQVRTPFEFTITVLVRAHKLSNLLMFLSHMSKNMRSFRKLLSTMLADEIGRSLGYVK